MLSHINCDYINLLLNVENVIIQGMPFALTFPWLMPPLSPGVTVKRTQCPLPLPVPLPPLSFHTTKVFMTSFHGINIHDYNNLKF